VFNLLIISVLFLNWDITGIGNSLIFSYRSGNWNIFNSLLGNLFSVLSFIWDLNVVNSLFIVSVSLLDWNIFNVRLILWSWLFENLSLNWLLDSWLNIAHWLSLHNWLSIADWILNNTGNQWILRLLERTLDSTTNKTHLIYILKSYLDFAYIVNILEISIYENGNY